MSKDLSIAYRLKNKNSKKMAKGGEVSAATEKRPMPETKGNDAKMIAKDRMPAKVPLSRPQMSKITGPFSVKDREKHELIEAPSKRRAIPEAIDIDKEIESKESLSNEIMKSLKPKKMAEGGLVDNEGEDDPEMEYNDADEIERGLDAESESEEDMPKEARKSALDKLYMADGGEVSEEEIDHAASIAAAIMAKRRMMAEGGEVDIESNGEEQPNMYYSRNKAALKENYDDDLMDVEQPRNSNLKGGDYVNEADNENDHDADLVAAIRRKMKVRSPITE